MSEEQHISNLEDLQRKQKNRRTWRKVQRWAVRILFLFLLLFTILYSLIRNERVQNAVIAKVTADLSERLDTKVEIDRFRLRLLDQIAFENFYLEDPTGDTLLHSEILQVNLNTNLLNLLQGKVIVNDVLLQDANIKLRRDTASFKHNIELLLARLTNPNSEKQEKQQNKATFELELDRLALRNVRFFKRDLMRGEDMNIVIDEGNIYVDKLDFANQHIAIEHADISGIRMDLEQYSRDENYFLYWYNYVPPVDTTQQASLVLTPTEEDEKPKGFIYTVEEFNLCDGAFFFDDTRNEPIKDTPDNILDYQHLSVVNIGGTARDFKFENRVFTGQLETLSFEEESGFVLHELAVDSAAVSPQKVELYKLFLTTDQSSMGDTLLFKYKTYEDFMEFKDKVRMDIRFNESTVAVSDITTFVPKLKDITFFNKNEGELLYLNGRFTGKINNLKGKNLDIRVGNNTLLKGQFNSRNLAVRNEEYMNLKLEQFRSTIPSLKELIPNFNLPPNFDKLGTIDFSGRFDGFFIDFVAFGELTTALGRSKLDMQMQFNEGRTNAKYTGGLSLIDFDLAQWSDDPRFGIVSFQSQVKNGTGLTLETVDADLSARIERFPFQGYTYQNLTMEGSLRRNFFDGDFNIKDDNIDFRFNGAINFENPTPIYDFDAIVNKLDLKTLQLSKQNFVFAGHFNLNLQGNNLSDMQGLAQVGQLSFIHNDSNYYEIDTISVQSLIDPTGKKQFIVNSDVLDLDVEGDFDIQKVPNVFQDYFIDKYPRYAAKFSLKKSEKGFVSKEFDFYLKIKNSRNLTQLLDPKLDTLHNVVLKGYLNNYRDSLNFDLEVEKLRYDQFLFRDIILLGEANANYSLYDVGIYSTLHKGTRHFAPVNLLATIEQDTVSFGLNSVNFSKGLDHININGNLSLTNDDLFQISFLPSNLVVLNQSWDIAADNYIRFGNKTIYTRNFQLTNDKNKIIKVESEGERGLALQVENFNLGIINDYWTYDKLIFDAPFTIKAATKDVFELTDLSTQIVADTFKVNQDDWGILQVNATMANLKDKVQSHISITKGTRQLIGEGYYVPPKSVAYNKGRVHVPNYFDFDFDINEYPLDILEYFIPTGISQTVGTFKAEVDLFGTPTMPNIGGFMEIYNGALNIDYLGTRYFIDKQRAVLGNQLFDGTGAVLTDRFGNTANVFGGISHDRFKNLELAARIETDRFLALETEKGDNPIFYGTAIGSGIIHFSGPFNKANIDAKEVVTDRGTKIVIPVSYDQDGSEASFIKFVDKSKKINKEEESKPYEIKGLNLTIGLSMTDQAETQLVFDERAGDILRGFGNGNIQMEISRAGDFTMYGNYEVDHGDYLFTYKVPNIDLALINKKFKVKRGGTIRWFGDPLAAIIDLEAEYKDLSASPYNLIADFVDVLPNESLKLEARKTTKVDLEMTLKGELKQPDIAFDINFPNLRGELDNYTENKLRLLRQDELELNRQVFGLIAIGSFLPTGEGALANQTGVLINNTVSQVISNQFSIYLTEFIRESITDGGAISGIDFDVNYSEYLYDDLTSIDELNKGKELSLRPRIYFLDDRLTLDVGLGIGLEDNVAIEGATGRLNSGDVVFEFSISEDRRLKIRAYNRYEQNITGQLNRTGVGLSYRREFDTFKEFFQGLKRKKKK